MPKSLQNFLKDRQKFSQKKRRAPIHKYNDGDEMKRCPLHDESRKRACIGAGCRHHDLKAELTGCAPRCATLRDSARARPRVLPVCDAPTGDRTRCTLQGSRRTRGGSFQRNRP